MFSDIVQRFDGTLNALYREREVRRVKGQKTIDLVSGNVNQAGFIFPPAVLKQALAAGAERARVYSPHPLGQRMAREAVKTYYRDQGVRLPAKQIVLTAGTSLSYAYLFKLLANPGDEILCPKPSYPLLNSIADLCDVQLTGYRLLEYDRWTIDFEDLKAQITAKTKAIVLISPHNPTGAVATDAEVKALAAIAARLHLPIISDEVFSAFLFQAKRLPRPATHDLPLVFTLNGVSKLLALPGMKIGWIGVTGEPAKVEQALHALDLISDTFLPVNEAAQFALPTLFRKGKAFLSAFQKEVQHRAAITMQALKGLPGVTFLPPEGGFYLTLSISGDEEETALRLLKKEGLLVHPGYFYDMEGSHLVLSFVTSLALLKGSLPGLIRQLRREPK